MKCSKRQKPRDSRHGNGSFREDGSVALASGHHSIDQTNNRLPPAAWQQHWSRQDSSISIDMFMFISSFLKIKWGMRQIETIARLHIVYLYLCREKTHILP